MAVVRRGKIEPKEKKPRIRYFAVFLEGRGDELESTLLIGADCFDLQEEGLVACFYSGGTESDYEECSGRKTVAAIKGWKRIMEINKDQIERMQQESEKTEKESSKKLNFVFVEPGKM